MQRDWMDVPFDAVAPELGLTMKGRRWGPCPACNEERSTKDARAPVIAIHKGAAWKCYACGDNGSAVNAVSFRLFGEKLGKGDHRWRDLIGWYADRGWAEQRGNAQPVKMRPIPAPKPQPVVHIDPSQVLRQCRPPDCREWLESRGYTRPVPAGMLPPGWACDWWPWPDRFPLVVPAFDTTGKLRSMHGRSLNASDDRKTTWPKGTTSRGLVMATKPARSLLRGESEPSTLIICEGLTDFLQLGQDQKAAILGVASGVDLSGLTLTSATMVIVVTDGDLAGDTYAQHIADQLAPHPVRRLECPRT